MATYATGVTAATGATGATGYATNTTPRTSTDAASYTSGPAYITTPGGGSAYGVTSPLPSSVAYIQGQSSAIWYGYSSSTSSGAQAFANPTTSGSSTSSSSSQGSSTNVAAIAGGVAAGIVVIALIIVLVWLRRRKAKKQEYAAAPRMEVDEPHAGTKIDPFVDADSTGANNLSRAYQQQQLHSHSQPVIGSADTGAAMPAAGGSVLSSVRYDHHAAGSNAGGSTSGGTDQSWAYDEKNLVPIGTTANTNRPSSMTQPFTQQPSSAASPQGLGQHRPQSIVPASSSSAAPSSSSSPPPSATSFSPKPAPPVEQEPRFIEHDDGGTFNPDSQAGGRGGQTIELPPSYDKATNRR